MSEHTSWNAYRQTRESAETRAGYDEARRTIEFADTIRERRLELGLSQAEVARRAGMTQPALSRLEGGGGTPTIGVLDRLADALGMRFVARFEPLCVA
jgi:ribosome-binding protein aMBF1 (putative translation factor)